MNEDVKATALESNFLQAGQILIMVSLLTPLVVFSNSFIFPFVFPRVIFFRSIVTLAAFCWVSLIFINSKKYAPRENILTWSVLIFLGSWVVSTIFGVDIARSIWDTQERMLGLYSIFNYVLFFFVLISLFQTWKDWRLLFWVYIGVAIVSFMVGIIQKADPSFLLNRDAFRIASTLGNPLYVSEYAAFLVFLSVFMIFIEKNKFLRILLFGTGILGLVNFVEANSRSTGMGVVIGIFCALTALVLFGHGLKKVRMTAGIIGVALSLLMGFLYIERNENWVQRIPVLGRIVNINLENAAGRLIAWDIAVKAGKDRIMLGWGPANYYFAFNYFYNPLSVQYGWQETWFDTAHNLFLNTFAERGIVGALSYLFIFIAPLVVLFKKKENEHGLLVLSFGIVFLATHFVHNFFVFENPTSYQYFFLFLAFAHVFGQNLNVEKNNAVQPVNAQEKRVSAKMAAAFVIAVVLFWRFNISPAMANNGIIKSLRLTSLNIDEGIKSFQNTLKTYTPHKEDVRIDYISSLLEVLPNPKNDLEKQFMIGVLMFSRDELMKIIDVWHPREIRAHLKVGTIDRVLSTLTGDNSYIEHAISAYDRGLKFSPKRQQLGFDKAGLLILVGKKDEAITVLKGMKDDAPNLTEPRKRLAFGYFEVGRKMEAVDELIGLFKDNNYVAQNQQEYDIFVRVFSESGLKIKNLEEKFSVLESNAYYGEMFEKIRQRLL